MPPERPPNAFLASERPRNAPFRVAKAGNGIPRYAELHCHTNFSFLDGAAHPQELVARASELGYSAIGVTDHDGFYGAVKVMEAARHLAMPVVYGIEIGIGHDGGTIDPIRTAEEWDRRRLERNEPLRRRGRSVTHHGTKLVDRKNADHLVLLAGSPGAYTVLSQLVSRAQLRGEKDRAVYSWTDLSDAASHPAVHALTGCWQGAVPRAAAAGDLSGALRETSRLRDLFGERLHVELWHHGVPGDDERNDLLWEVGSRLGLTCVATNQVHHALRSDSALADVLAAIAGRRDLHLRPRVLAGHRRTAPEGTRGDGPALRPLSRGGAAFGGAGRCGLHSTWNWLAPALPPFPMPGHFRDEMDYLRSLTFEAARHIYPGTGEGGVEPSARRRLEHELGIIDRLGFPGYFLVVKDIVDFARSQDIYCQIRGSGADSAVCRCHRTHPGRSHPPRPALRTVPVRGAGPPARHRPRPRGRPAGGGHPVLLPPLRPGAGGDGRQRHHLPGPVGAA
jgi:error-prone DNA polymerase